MQVNLTSPAFWWHLLQLIIWEKEKAQQVCCMFIYVTYSFWTNRSFHNRYRREDAGRNVRATADQRFLVELTALSRPCGYISPQVVHLVQDLVPFNGWIIHLLLLQNCHCFSTLKYTLNVAAHSLNNAIEQPHGWNENCLKTKGHDER